LASLELRAVFNRLFFSLFLLAFFLLVFSFFFVSSFCLFGDPIQCAVSVILPEAMMLVSPEFCAL